MPTHLHSACVHASVAHALHGPSLTQQPETLLAGRQVRGVVAAGDRHVTDSPMLSAWPREDEGQRVHMAWGTHMVTMRALKRVMGQDPEDRRSCLNCVAISGKKIITRILVRGHGSPESMLHLHRGRRVFRKLPQNVCLIYTPLIR